MKTFTKSPEETKRLAAEFAATLKGGEFMALEGGLGAGKTTFVQGLADALGVKEPVRSPTFTVMNVHVARRGAIKRLVHLDFYRLREGAIDDLGLEDFVGQPDTVVLAEWPHPTFPLPKQVITVRFTLRSETQREIEIIGRDA
jgi:tRNA threonylcarbamoyladenosine biosynthesis protein TsaE